MNNTLARSRPAEILLVEDNENDVLLTREAFRRSHLMVNLHHARDGEACMAFLRQQGEHAGAPVPDLILLDLNMPRKGGKEVLAEIGTDERLRHLPVIVLTTSAAERDILEMYRLRCSGYIVKPVDFEQFSRVVKQFADYWFTVVVLPSTASIAAGAATDPVSAP